MPFDLERIVERLQKPLGGGPDLLGVGHVGQQNRELVAADPRDRVLRTQPTLDSTGDLLEERVADQVPERVVDVLEAVDVEKQTPRPAGSLIFACSTAPASCSWKRVLLGSPVSASWRD